MHLTYPGVNEAFGGLVSLFHRAISGGICVGLNPKLYDVPIRATSSRYGDVYVIDEPVTVTYTRPWERVLFNQARDCNPFFHLYEALWMLAGRNDVAPLVYYNKRMAEFSDDGRTLHGAYGYRWRKYFGYDQIDWIVGELRANPDSRRCILQMWDGGRTVELSKDDELRRCVGDPEPIEGASDLYAATHGGKDVCCNVCVMFLICKERKDNWRGTGLPVEVSYLDMTVINRSNDLVWGMLGANVVHMSLLQEYAAGRLGIRVGKYHQVTNNLHVYKKNWEPEKWLECEQGEAKLRYYPEDTIVPLLRIREQGFDQQCIDFVDRWKGWYGSGDLYLSPFLQDVARPLMMAFRNYKRHDYSCAMRCLESCKADDWRRAATNWLQRRIDRRVPTQSL